MGVFLNRGIRFVSYPFNPRVVSLKNSSQVDTAFSYTPFYFSKSNILVPPVNPTVTYVLPNRGLSDWMPYNVYSPIGVSSFVTNPADTIPPIPSNKLYKNGYRTISYSTTSFSLGWASLSNLFTNIVNRPSQYYDTGNIPNLTTQFDSTGNGLVFELDTVNQLVRLDASKINYGSNLIIGSNKIIIVVGKNLDRPVYDYTTDFVIGVNFNCVSSVALPPNVTLTFLSEGIVQLTAPSYPFYFERIDSNGSITKALVSGPYTDVWSSNVISAPTYKIYGVQTYPDNVLGFSVPYIITPTMVEERSNGRIRGRGK